MLGFYALNIYMFWMTLSGREDRSKNIALPYPIESERMFDSDSQNVSVQNYGEEISTDSLSSSRTRSAGFGAAVAVAFEGDEAESGLRAQGFSVEAVPSTAEENCLGL
nr:hypothetical protein Itr_chr08CG13210 [Ipomoea trifida]